MNGESRPADMGTGPEELTGLLREAVDEIRVVPAQQELARTIIERVAIWASQEYATPAAVAQRTARVSRVRKWTLAAAAAIAVVALTAGAVAVWLHSTTSQNTMPRVVKPNDSNQPSPDDKAKEKRPAPHAR